MEEVEAEVDERAHHGPSVHLDVSLVEVPAARPRHDDRYAVGVLQRVVLAFRGGELDGAAHGVAQVDLAADDVGPVGGVGVLEVGQPDASAGVEGVDGHLALGGPGDLDAAVGEVLRDRRHRPVPGPDLGRLREEVEAPGLGDRGPARDAGLQQLVTARAEAGLQVGEELQRLGGQDLVAALDRAPGHGDVCHQACLLVEWRAKDGWNDIPSYGIVFSPVGNTVSRSAAERRQAARRPRCPQSPRQQPTPWTQPVGA